MWKLNAGNGCKLSGSMYFNEHSSVDEIQFDLILFEFFPSEVNGDGHVPSFEVDIVCW